MDTPATSEPARRLWAARAWLAGGWQDDVLLEVGADGHWSAVRPGQACPADAERLDGPALPGLINGHSHAFQRAFAGLAEQREQGHDDFWGWRDRMYRVARQLDPPALQAIASHLYAELLRGGYTQVCEFHYLQHRPDGTPWTDPLAMSQALIQAARDSGIGLTLLPVLYERAGFDQPALRPDQRGFLLDADAVWQVQRAVSAQADATLNAGLAIHSLRAARPDSIHRLAELAQGFPGAIHVHVAEQTAEIEACLAATGQRPVEWLAGQGLLDPRWQLVHATHVTPEEIRAVGQAGSTVVICPATEANLGDGLTDLPGWLAARVPIAVGSDSQVCRSWREELRWLEYGQRLGLRQRNVAAAPEQGQASTATRLFEACLDGGRRAAGLARWGLVAGARADLLVVDLADASLAGMPPERLLDALLFSSPGRPWREVMVAGQWRVRQHRLTPHAGMQQDFAAVMDRLWG